MLNKHNLHLHTTYADRKDSPEELLSSVGFSTRFILTDKGFVEVEL